MASPAGKQWHTDIRFLTLEIGSSTLSANACKTSIIGEGTRNLNVIVNGEPQTVDDGLTLAALLETLDMRPKYVAVERNLELVPRAEHAECVLSDGDRLEIVTLVGGG